MSSPQTPVPLQQQPSPSPSPDANSSQEPSSTEPVPPQSTGIEETPAPKKKNTGGRPKGKRTPKVLKAIQNLRDHLRQIKESGQPKPRTSYVKLGKPFGVTASDDVKSTVKEFWSEGLDTKLGRSSVLTGFAAIKAQNELGDNASVTAIAKSCRVGQSKAVEIQRHMQGKSPRQAQAPAARRHSTVKSKVPNSEIIAWIKTKSSSLSIKDIRFKHDVGSGRATQCKEIAFNDMGWAVKKKSAATSATKEHVKNAKATVLPPAKRDQLNRAQLQAVKQRFSEATNVPLKQWDKRTKDAVVLVMNASLSQYPNDVNMAAGLTSSILPCKPEHAAAAHAEAVAFDTPDITVTEPPPSPQSLPAKAKKRKPNHGSAQTAAKKAKTTTKSKSKNTAKAAKPKTKGTRTSTRTSTRQ